MCHFHLVPEICRKHFFHRSYRKCVIEGTKKEVCSLRNSLIGCQAKLDHFVILLSRDGPFFLLVSKFDRKCLCEFLHMLLSRVCRLIIASDQVCRLHLAPEICCNHFHMVGISPFPRKAMYIGFVLFTHGRISGRLSFSS